MNMFALTSYDMFKLATHTSRIPLHLNHQVQSRWQCKQYPAVLRSVQLANFSRRKVSFLLKSLPGFKHRLGMNVCHSQGCSVGRNHFEKDETVLKMNLTLGDQELLSIQATF
jgi:hypothetical protein